MTEINIQLQVLGLHKDVRTVFEEKLKEGISNLPEAMKVTLATEEAAEVLDNLALTFDEKEELEIDDLLNIAACYFTMAMSERILDEFEEDETPKEDKSSK
jgi:hypothetical protein